MKTSSLAKTVDIIVPIYNEEEMLPVFHKMLCEAVEKLPYAFTIYYINDGSTDGTLAHLEQIARADSGVVGIELSLNFGHQAALTAGLDRA
jgi:glycosyltransferase involved in cell wall biosynthesis